MTDELTEELWAEVERNAQESGIPVAVSLLASVIVMRCSDDEDELQHAIAEALMHERERCATVAENAVRRAIKWGPDITLAADRKYIAALIRTGENEQCGCDACAVKPHLSSCAVHNDPGLPVGECDCGAPDVPAIYATSPST